MEYSLLKDNLNKKAIQAYFTGRNYDKLFYPTFFPLKSTPYLSFETLIGSKGNRVAADIVAYDASAPLKTRKTVSKLSGEIPSLRMKKKMTEVDLNTYNIIKAMETGPNEAALRDLIFGDIDACVDGVNAKLELMVFQALSKGVITLNKVNNAGGVITETDIDFQLPAANKKVASVDWSDGHTTTKPITDIEAVMAAAGALGIKPQYILMNRTKWSEFRISDETLDFVAPYALYGGTRKKRSPSLTVANEALQSEGLPIIVIIDTRIDIEDAEHAMTSVDPWVDSAGADRFITFLETFECGNMLTGPIAEETNPPKQVIQVKKGPILISKWSDVDPVAEYTKGELNAFPSWPTIDRALSLDSESTTTWNT